MQRGPGARYRDQEKFNDERKNWGMTPRGEGRRTETLEDRASRIQSHAEDTSTNNKPSHEEIRLRAYEIYLERGWLPGHELDDWLQAEGELERASPSKAKGFSN
jgi:hypothetical protein